MNRYSYLEVRHDLRKFWSTLAICWRIILARSFGVYRHSGVDEHGDFCLYNYRGVDFRIPTERFK